MDFSQNKARERIPIHKANGVTSSEIYLNHLCEQTFLSLWSYPSIFRDQKLNGKGDGKELCDMLVVFDDNVLIFSDKHCNFPSSGDLELDWARWYKRAIEKSATQAWGAERWLKTFPTSAYLDRGCTTPLPIKIPDRNSAKFHLIAITHGSEERSKIEIAGSESLMFTSSVNSNMTDDIKTPEPFLVNDLDPNKTFIHVFTGSSLEILLFTLDTIRDFVSYLEKREKFLRSNTSIFSPGEEELLASYLKDINDEGVHDFIFNEDLETISLEKGSLKDFCKSPQRLEQIKQNEISYAWDNLIEKFCYHALSATQYFTNHLELSETEIGLRFMAGVPRTGRRLIMNSIVNMFFNTPDGMFNTKCLKPLSLMEPFFVFLCLPQPNYATYEQYREGRMSLLEACLMVVKYKFPEATDIVGIASEPIQARNQSSEDLLYLDAREWSSELDKEAEKLQKDLKILTAPSVSYHVEKDYPEISET